MDGVRDDGDCSASAPKRVKLSETLSSRVNISDLKTIMRKNTIIITKWRDIGLELLESDGKLNVIANDHSGKMEACCTEMFNQWLERDLNASWNKIITTLQKIELNVAAKYIEDNLPTGSSFRDADFTVVFTGPFGAGKSAACNFFMGREVFESRPSLITVTKEAASCVVTIEGKYIKLADTPGFLDPNSIKEEECLEFAKGLISIQYGFHAIGVVLNLNTNIENDAASLFKNLLSIYNNYLPYIFLMFTHGKDFGQTDRQQKLAITKMLQGKPKDSNISKILKNINYRYLVIESVENMKEGYHACKSKELLNTVQAIFRQTGTLTNNHFALSITHSFKVTQIVLEAKSTQYAQVVQEKTRDAKGEEAKTSSSEESNDSKNEEKSSISGNKEAYRSLESIAYTAMSQDKNITLVIEDKKITLKISS